MKGAEVATFGAGCFWGVEEAFRTVKGVAKTEVGFMGGTRTNPTYEEVCSHTTGHAEVVQITFDPKKIQYKELLKIFWDIHDPTTKDRQGPDIGSQYRSVIFFHSEEQKKQAEDSKTELEESEKYSEPIVTAIEPVQEFYKAEKYHQQYLYKRGQKGCHI